MDPEYQLLQVCIKALCAILYQKLYWCREIQSELLSLVQVRDKSYAQCTLIDSQWNHPVENRTAVGLENQFLVENYIIEYMQFFQQFFQQFFNNQGLLYAKMHLFLELLQMGWMMQWTLLQGNSFRCLFRSKVLFTWNAGKPQLKHDYDYYAQIQGQLGVAQAKWWDFVMYTDKGLSIERIKYDHQYWINMKNILQSLLWSFHQFGNYWIQCTIAYSFVSAGLLFDIVRKGTVVPFEQCVLGSIFVVYI